MCDETELFCGERLRIIDAWLTGVILWCLPSTCSHRVLRLEVVRVPESDAISRDTRGDEVSLSVRKGFDLRGGDQDGDVRSLPPGSRGADTLEIGERGAPGDHGLSLGATYGKIKRPSARLFASRDEAVHTQHFHQRLAMLVADRVPASSERD